MLSPGPCPNVCRVNGGFGGAHILVRAVGAHRHADDFMLHGDSWRLTVREPVLGGQAEAFLGLMLWSGV